VTPGPVLIVGARSDIAMAVAHRFAAEGHPVQLAARAPERLEEARADLTLRHGVEATLHALDILDTGAHGPALDALPELPHIAVCAVGLMEDQAALERDPDAAMRVMRSNYEGPALLIGELANRMEARGFGTLVGISSVAGLRNRLARKGVHVVTVLPGFVDTEMTRGMDLPAPLTAKPDQVAEHVFAAVRRERDVIYTLGRWRLVMTIIRSIPEATFKKLRL
jgi:short-subunit dehydrogenase